MSHKKDQFSRNAKNASTWKSPVDTRALFRTMMDKPVSEKFNDDELSQHGFSVISARYLFDLDNPNIQ